MHYPMRVSASVVPTPRTAARQKVIKKFKFIKQARKRAVNEVYPGMRAILDEIAEKLDENSRFNLETKLQIEELEANIQC